ncbi:hypothetical protein IW261DRAFT_1565171 [Armillaria novae-zelandiae]|uniref:PHD-type domain-containing protein n=1 Tax=Armillaria novae-zelandiae TaxID=153914 RepID=A0AA39P6S6_9AGAR|nr:hypothetical protein IW261DRAFT_1565171 [Armillaria novae-zelandiae]
MSDFDPNRTLANTPSSSGRLDSSFSSSSSGLMSLMNPLPPPEPTSRYCPPSHTPEPDPQYDDVQSIHAPTYTGDAHEFGYEAACEEGTWPCNASCNGHDDARIESFCIEAGATIQVMILTLPRIPLEHLHLVLQLYPSRPLHRLPHLSSPFSAKPVRGSPMHVDDVFSVSKPSTLQSPPLSPPHVGAGGEIDRIRHAMAQEQKEVEKRRPEYMKRSKRPLEDGEEGPAGQLSGRDYGERRVKRALRRALMAGGYGRYRTADWVRQPQPMLVAPEVSVLEAEEPPPLEAFRSENQIHHGPSRLFPVELEGKGRVLLDIPNESLVPESGKRRNGAGNSRKKKKDGEKERSAGIEMEERQSLARAEEKERLGWIERFLDRDTDDEGDVDGDGDGDVIPSAKWGVVYDDEGDRPVPARRGRGKMIGTTRRSMSGPWNTGGRSGCAAVTATMRSCASAGGLTDGRELVQCDDCKMWYHLACIGIRSYQRSRAGGGSLVLQLIVSFRPGAEREEEEEEEELYREPTFAPTDMDYPPRRRGYDAIFAAGAIDDSPAFLPRTPRSYDHYEEPPFDPTSTPSRGIKFSGPFATPKNTMWGRGAGPFHTPVRLDDSPIRRHE